MRKALILAAALPLTCDVGAARADATRASVSAPAGTVVLKVHAVGAQIYECKAGQGGALVWTFGEPIAALIADGRTIGRHFAGPSWEMADGSLVIGRVIDKAPGASPADIPWLKLAITEHKGDGVLGNVATVQRVDTVGGNKAGACEPAGMLAAEPYSADYVFSRP